MAMAARTPKTRKPIPKPGRKLSFREAQKLIIAKFGPAFEKLAK